MGLRTRENRNAGLFLHEERDGFSSELPGKEVFEALCGKVVEAAIFWGIMDKGV